MGGSLLSLDAARGPKGEDIVAKVLDDERSREATELILAEAKADATRLLKTHQPIHAALRNALLEREELVGEEILEVIRVAILEDELAEIDLRDPATQDVPAPQAPL
jgi:hypothetical protein